MLEGSERVACCTKDSLWLLYDVFTSMDQRGAGAIRRCDLAFAWGKYGTNAGFLKAVRKAGLSGYFASTAEELPLERFIQLALPSASPLEVVQMLRWTEMRRAHHILALGTFRAHRDELERIFALLKGSGREELGVEDMLQSGVLPRDEVGELMQLMPAHRTSLTFAEFEAKFLPALAARYCHLDAESEVSLAVRHQFNGLQADEVAPQPPAPGAAPVVSGGGATPRPPSVATGSPLPVQKANRDACRAMHRGGAKRWRAQTTCGLTSLPPVPPSAPQMVPATTF